MNSLARIAKHLRRRPQPPEQSWVLRGLSLMATAISLAALAWVGGELAWAAILLAIAATGNLFSWYRRERRSSTVHLLIVLVVLAIATPAWNDLLALFSGGLLLPVARFLATAQAIASFGLRTRRNLYDGLALSLAILLILGEQALSLAFLGYLLAFAAVALTFMVASHVSSSGERAERVAFPTFGLTLGAGVVTTVGTLAVAAFLFLALPQNHTVAFAGPLPSRLDLTSGWPPPPAGVSEGDWAPWAQFLPSRDLEVSLGGEGGTATSIDTTQYTKLGYTDDQGSNVVLRVSSPLASFWRGYTLDAYDGHGWITTSQEVRLQVDPAGRLRFAEAPSRRPRGDTYVQSYFLRVNQPNAVFTAYTPGWIALGSGGTTGGLEAFQDNLKYLQQASPYRIISPVPRLTPEALRQDRIDTSDAAYLAPPPVPERVKLLAQEIVEGAPTDYDRAARLERFLLTQYPYDLRVAPYPKEGGAVDIFLFEQQKGYCSQFATAMAVMGRLVGLPTRVAVGYLPGRYNSLTAVHEVSFQDAHAWVEVRFEEHGWVPFDPTPQPDSPWAMGFGDASLAMGFQQVIRNGFMGLVIEAPGRALGDIASFQGPGLLLGATAVVLVSLAGTVVWLARHHSRRRGSGKERPASPYTLLAGAGRTELRKVYQQALQRLHRQGHPPPLAHQTPREYLASLPWNEREPMEAFRRLSEGASAAAYNPGPLADDLPQQAWQWLRQLDQ